MITKINVKIFMMEHKIYEQDGKTFERMLVDIVEEVKNV